MFLERVISNEMTNKTTETNNCLYVYDNLMSVPNIPYIVNV